MQFASSPSPCTCSTCVMLLCYAFALGDLTVLQQILAGQGSSCRSPTGEKTLDAATR